MATHCADEDNRTVYILACSMLATILSLAATLIFVAQSATPLVA